MNHTDQPDLSIIAHYRSARSAHEAGLAVLAAGESYWVFPDESSGGYVLAVERSQAARLRREIDLAERRNRFWPPGSLGLPSQASRIAPTGWAILILVACFVAQNLIPGLAELGRNSSEAFWNDDEYWRLITAMTLHADLSHLAGNLMGIALFAYFCGRYMGNGLAWLAILIAGGLSNLTNVVLNPNTPFLSLGASTAVFAALGLLTGFPAGTHLRTRQPVQPREWLLPFFGGCVLLAWLGGGGPDTDILAHLWSFAYGIALAIAISSASLQDRLSARHQHALLVVATALPATAWLWALIG